MRYPMLYDGVVMRRANEQEYQVKDFLTGEEFLLPGNVARFARKLDGKRNPYTLDRRLSREDVDDYLDLLDEYELIRESRVLAKGFGRIIYSLWFPKRTLGLCLIAKGYTFLLNVLWLPMLLFSIWLVCQGCDLQGECALVPGMLLGILAGAFLHEFSHLCAGVCYGAYVFEMGVMIEHFMPGAYVLMERSHIKSRKAHLHILSAGIKANIFFTGVCCALAATVLPGISIPLLASAISNAVIGLANTAFVDGLDGMFMISRYLGIGNLEEFSKEIVWKRKKRKAMLAKGVTGYAVVVLCVTIRIAWLALPLLGIISLVGCLEVRL